MPPIIGSIPDINSRYQFPISVPDISSRYPALRNGSGRAEIARAPAGSGATRFDTPSLPLWNSGRPGTGWRSNRWAAADGRSGAGRRLFPDRPLEWERLSPLVG